MSRQECVGMSILYPPPHTLEQIVGKDMAINEMWIGWTFDQMLNSLFEMGDTILAELLWKIQYWILWVKVVKVNVSRFNFWSAFRVTLTCRCQWNETSCRGALTCRNFNLNGSKKAIHSRPKKKKLYIMQGTKIG